MEAEQIFRADGDAVAAGSALISGDDRQPMAIEMDGIELADLGAVADAEASPGAALAAAGNQGGTTAGADPAIGRPNIGDVATTGAGKPRDPLLGTAKADAEEIGNDLVHFFRVDRALPWFGLVLDQLFGERPAPGRTTGPAVGLRQQVLDLVDAGVFVDVQLLVRNDQHRGQDKTQCCHKDYGGEYDFHAPVCSAIALR